MKVIIISPHFDDAVFSVSSVIMRNARHVQVWTVFSGMPDKEFGVSRYDKLKGFESSRHTMVQRCLENDHALSLLGVSEDNVYNFGFLDNQYRNGERIDESLQSVLEGMIERELLSNDPRIYVFCPIALQSLEYRHVDHSTVSSVFIRMIREKRYPIEWKMYAEIPYVEMGEKKDLESLAKNELGARSVSMRTVLLQEHEKLNKLSACQKYKSQINGNVLRMAVEVPERTFDIIL